MSIILDALRRGRGRRASTAPNLNAAQTDAVLQTLGYGRLTPATPASQLKRVAAYLTLVVVSGAVLWFVVFRISRSLWSPALPVQGAAPPQPQAATTLKPPRAPHDVGASSEPATGPSPPITPAEAEAPAVAPSAPTPSTPPSAAARTSVPAVESPRPVAVTAGDDHFARAMMYQRLGDFENALVSYRHVLQRDDLNVEAHNNLGVLYRDKGLLDEATRHFQRAIAINPSYARARNNLGVVYLAQRKLEMSATQFHAALAIDPKNVESMVNLSTVEKESGERDEARRWLARAIAIDARNAAAHYNLGLLEDEAGSPSEALSHYRAFVQYGAVSHPTLAADVRKRMDALSPR